MTLRLLCLLFCQVLQWLVLLYLDAYLPRVDARGAGRAAGRAGVPAPPTHPGRAEQVEETLGSHGISVLFYDETRRRRPARGAVVTS